MRAATPRERVAMEWDRDAEWNGQNAGGGIRDSGQALQLTVLFVVVFLWAFFPYYLAWLFWTSVETHELVKQVVVPLLMASSMFSGYGVVAFFKMRNTLAIRCAAWPAGIAGVFLSFTAMILLTPSTAGDPPAHVSDFTMALFPLTLVLIGVVPGEFAVLRARFLFSEKTRQWLSSYSSKRRFTFAAPVQTFDEITVDDILSSNQAKSKKGAFTVILFLDAIPDGEHYLKAVSLMRRKNKFFSLKFTDKSPITTTLPVDRGQVEAVYEKCGPFKKTFFIALSDKAAVRRGCSVPNAS